MSQCQLNIINALIDEAVDSLELQIDALDLRVTNNETDITVIQNDITNITNTLGDITIYSGIFTWTNAELKAGTQKVVVAAPGANKVIIPISIVLSMIYGGSNVFTNAPTLTFRHGANPTISINVTGTFWTSASSRNAYQSNFADPDSSLALFTNGALSVNLSTGLTGNAANDNVVKVGVYYYIVDNN